MCTPPRKTVMIFTPTLGGETCPPGHRIAKCALLTAVYPSTVLHSDEGCVTGIACWVGVDFSLQISNALHQHQCFTTSSAEPRSEPRAATSSWGLTASWQLRTSKMLLSSSTQYFFSMTWCCPSSLCSSSSFSSLVMTGSRMSRHSGSKAVTSMWASCLVSYIQIILCISFIYIYYVCMYTSRKHTVLYHFSWRHSTLNYNNV